MGDERSTNGVDLQIGRRLRARRLERGMSQEHLADQLGVTFQQVQKYEKGVNRIAASRLFDICRVLETPMGYFYDGLAGCTARAEHDSVVEKVLATREGQELISLFSAIKSRKVRQRVLELARAVVDAG